MFIELISIYEDEQYVLISMFDVERIFAYHVLDGLVYVVMERRQYKMC